MKLRGPLHGWTETRRCLLGRDGVAGEPRTMAITRILYRYERYFLTGIDPSTADKTLLADLPEERAQFLDCVDADGLARHGAMSGDQELARRQVDYLADAGYRNPAYLEFCTNEGICDP